MEETPKAGQSNQNDASDLFGQGRWPTDVAQGAFCNPLHKVLDREAGIAQKADCEGM